MKESEKPVPRESRCLGLKPKISKVCFKEQRVRNRKREQYNDGVSFELIRVQKPSYLGDSGLFQ